ncbi:hypothetical protein BJ742DRAFT_220192 [Cladochytrium replicatum]|nr:hypothetical protein BJ742DRAFT_220192 [Cladochytrium replicatum]
MTKCVSFTLGLIFGGIIILFFRYIIKLIIAICRFWFVFVESVVSTAFLSFYTAIFRRLLFHISSTQTPLKTLPKSNSNNFSMSNQYIPPPNPVVSAQPASPAQAGVPPQPYMPVAPAAGAEAAYTPPAPAPGYVPYPAYQPPPASGEVPPAYYESKPNFAAPPQPYFPPQPGPYVVGVPPVPANKEAYKDPCLTAMGIIFSILFGFISFLGYCCIDGPRKISYTLGLAIGLPILGISSVVLYLTLGSNYYSFYYLSPTYYIVYGVIDVLAGVFAGYNYLQMKKQFLSAFPAGSA